MILGIRENFECDDTLGKIVRRACKETRVLAESQQRD